MASSPRVLVADEPVSALDMLVRDEILELIGNLTKHEGHALVLVSHDLTVIARLCERVAVMHEGRIIEEGATTKVFSRPEHPLTGALISAVPRFGFQ
jgi:ABC-type dipeptide/oligopeptide/nickel transport system ATPase component